MYILTSKKLVSLLELARIRVGKFDYLELHCEVSATVYHEVVLYELS